MSARRYRKGKAVVRGVGIAVLGAVAAWGLLPIGRAQAGQLTYVPVNPSFGGNPLNGSYLLSSAQAGKRYPLPMEDLDLPEFDTSVLAQTDKFVMYQRNGKLYLLDTTTGTVKQLPDDASPQGIEP